MNTLTKAEEQVMQAVWKIGRLNMGCIKAMPVRKPHQSTVSTILKILVEKEFIGIKVFERQHQYFALISKEAYSKNSFKSLVKGYFGGLFSESGTVFIYCWPFFFRCYCRWFRLPTCIPVKKKTK